MDLGKLKSTFNNVEQIEKVRRRIRNNDTVAFFYELLADKKLEEDCYYDGDGEPVMRYVPSKKYRNVAENMRHCCDYWEVNYYRLQGVKDLVRTNACHNKFCNNCQHTISVQRARKYSPLLDFLYESFDIYQIVFTVPNPTGEDLKGCLDNMYKQIGYIFRLFRGNVKIKGYDFERLGYYGGIRALEITREKERPDHFHPHFHCLVVFKKGLKLDVGRKIINRFSFDREHTKKNHHRKAGEPYDYFSEFDILLQKIWRLRIDGKKVNRENIEALSEGYSVKCRNADKEYKEVFKYAVKGLFTPKNGKAETIEEAIENFSVTQKEFEILHEALEGRRILQGYGKLYGLDFKDEVDQSASADEKYLKIVKFLHEIENPERVFEHLSEIIKEVERKNITYISRNSILEILERAEREEDWELK